MKTVVYIDVYFLLNFAVDMICISICGLLGGKRSGKTRLVVSSSIGGVFACIALGLQSPYDVLLSSAICLLMYGIAYNTRRPSALVWGGLLLFAVSGMFGGVYTALISFAANGNLSGMRTGYILILLTAAIMLVFGRLIISRAGTEACTAEITRGEKTASLTAIIDTGNFLREPISGIGVAMICSKAAIKLFNEIELSVLSGNNRLNAVRGLRYCPIRTATGNSVIPCVKADRFSIKTKNGKFEGVLYLALSDNVDASGAECILPNSVKIIK